jgi:NAD-dependent SIR2 family protein deacetylase
MINRTFQKSKNFQFYLPTNLKPKRHFLKTNLESSKEYFDDKDTFKKNVDLISDILTTSKRTLVFCGAGLSTASGIPDYRSGYDTKLATGPGKWEREKHNEKPYEKEIKVKVSTDAWPNRGHLALKALENANLVHYIISQNVDGLLSRSMIQESKMSELHGNMYIERCLSCDKLFYRDFTTTKKDMRRITERKCLCSAGKPGGYTYEVTDTNSG